MFLNNHSDEELSNLFKTLAFGSANPKDHPLLVQIAEEIAMQMQFIGTLAAANATADALRRNLDVNFWLGRLKMCITLTEKNFSLYGQNPKLLLEQGCRIDITSFAFSPTAPLHIIPLVHLKLVFKLALIGASKMDRRIFASVYSLVTSEWSDAIFTGPVYTIYHFGSPAILFNLETLTLAVTDGNWPETNFSSDCRYCIMRGEDDNVGLTILLYRGFQMWERKVTLGGAAKWVLRKTVKLHDILGLSSAVQREKIDIVGYAEDLNAFILVVDTAFYMVPVDSMQFKKLFDCNVITRCHPFTSFYTAVLVPMDMIPQGVQNSMKNIYIDAAIEGIGAEDKLRLDC
uniref:Uncharacterized protein n=1 Tax=Oryza glumipatula TaxID=40148 RepID=A0A0E0B7N8_9ORYZ